ncbi:FAD-dependent oxidoreductase, partial [Streptomyces clavuligerus]|uniref:FAD-dependent oxidoreductase n=1 Tax=Streptomyces clavuligerus TaxID=1901 RepID=UPI003F682BD9
TDDGHHHPYDRLVYALGSRTPDVTGEHVYTAESADRLRKRLQDRPGTLAVVGGGLTGIEMAAEIAEAHPDWTVRLLSAGQVAAGHTPRGRDHVRTVLAGLGVRVGDGGARAGEFVEAYPFGEVVGGVDEGHPGVRGEPERGQESAVSGAKDDDVPLLPGVLLRVGGHARGTTQGPGV